METDVKKMVGLVEHQAMFEGLLELALEGMNIRGTGAHVETSGERNVIDLVCRSTGDKPVVVFDVGANVGKYAAAVLGTFGERVQLYCFEPAKKTYEKLKGAMGSSPRARLLNVGLSAKQGAVELFTDRWGSGVASLYQRSFDSGSLDFRELVTLRTLDDVCEEHGVSRIALLKMDVEGNELQVLQGAGRMLDAGGIQCIQFEFGSCNKYSKTYFKDFSDLLGARFDFYRIVRDGLYPITAYSDNLEILGCANYVAILKTVKWNMAHLLPTAGGARSGNRAAVVSVTHAPSSLRLPSFDGGADGLVVTPPPPRAGCVTGGQDVFHHLMRRCLVWVNSAVVGVQKRLRRGRV